jgi:hypothetical protein
MITPHIPADFEPPLNRVVGPIGSEEEAEHVRRRFALLILLHGDEFNRLREILREDLQRLIAWEEEQR